MISPLYKIRQKKRVKPFLALNGDKTLRQDYNLNEDSVVIDVGGYEGQWSSDIYSRYSCIIHIFEPVHSFVDLIKKRFENNHKMIIHESGLSSLNTKKIINVSKDASSIIQKNGYSSEIDLIDVKDFFNDNNIEKVDLIKINIEGAEYDLLDRMIETGLIIKIKNIQVQFHDFFPEAKERMRKIQKELEKTHKLTYQYIFVWENWTLK